MMEKWIEKEGIVEMPHGLLGFPHAKRFMILESDEDEPIFRWLQSVDDPEVAFLIADPDLFIENYWEHVPVSDLRECRLESYESPIFLVIVTVPADDPYGMTANLQAPLVFSTVTRKAWQVVLSNSPYSPRHPVFEQVCAVLSGASRLDL